MDTSSTTNGRRLRDHVISTASNQQRRLLLDLGRLAAELDIQLQDGGVGAVSRRDGWVGSIVGVRRTGLSGHDGVAILRFTSRLGYGERLIAIPLSHVSIDDDLEPCLLTIDRQSLENAPTLDLGDPRTLHDPAWFAAVRDYFDNEGGWGDVRSDENGSPEQDEPRAQAGRASGRR